MIKKILTVALCLVMLSCIMIPVFADGNTGAEPAAQTAGIETKYGTISEEYSDAATYPWAIFSEGELKAALASWSSSDSSSVLGWLGANTSAYSEKDMQILLRADYNANNDAASASWHTYTYGKLTFDLDGHTVSFGTTISAPFIRIMLDGNGTNASALNVDVKNGTLIAQHKYGPLFYIGANNKGPGDHLGINITAENVNLVSTSTDTSGGSIGFFASTLNSTKSGNAFDNYPINLILTNCEITAADTVPMYNTANLTNADVLYANVNYKSAELEKTGVYTAGDFTADVTVKGAHNIDATTLTLEIAQNGTALTTETLDVVAGNTDKTLSALANITSTEGTLTVTLKSGETVLKEIVLEALACDGENHIYDQQIIDAAYLKSEADCQSAAVYYASCACGAHDPETSPIFTSGEKDPYKHTGTLVNNVYDCCGKSIAHLVTEYGIISEAFEDAEAYPWAIFSEGQFITALGLWAKDNTKDGNDTSVLTWLEKHTSEYADKPVDILLRRNYTVNASEENADDNSWWSFGFGELTFDLGGHTFNNSEQYAFMRMFYPANASSASGKTLNVNIINGTLKQTSHTYGLLLYIGGTGTSNGGHLGVNIYASDIIFVTNAGTNIGHFGGNVGNFSNYPVNVTLNNCKMDASDGGAAAPGWNTSNITSGSVIFTVDCLHGVHDGDLVCDFCGEVFVNLTGHSTTLGENLGINFYAAIPENVISIKITVAGAEQTFLIGELTQYDGIYKISSVVSSINLREDITIEFFDAEETPVELTSSKGTALSYTTSVFAYANRLIADENQSDEVKEVAKALLNYGAYAEEYFGKVYTGENIYDESVKALVTADGVTVTGTVSASGDTSILGNVQLVLDNATKIRIFINAEEINISGTDAAKVTVRDGFIEIENIDAANLDTVYSFTVNGAEVQISATGAAAYVVNSGAFDEAAVNLMKALYLYAISVNELPESL